MYLSLEVDLKRRVVRISALATERSLARRGMRGEEIKVFVHGRLRYDDFGAREHTCACVRTACMYREGDNVFKVRPVSHMVG